MGKRWREEEKRGRAKGAGQLFFFFLLCSF
jgi:hypothetical protein